MSRGRPAPRLSKRAVLRGAGIALALPWLESLMPKAARAQAAPRLPRFMPIYLPNGAPELWKPAGVGAGDAWHLSSVLEPLAPLKPWLTVISGLENGSVFNADGSAIVAPAHGRLPGAWLTCVDAAAVRAQNGGDDSNGISIDQVLAISPPVTDGTPIPSLQVGLSSLQSSCDGQPCSLTRSVSWLSERIPTYKLVDPKQVFQQLVAAIPPDPPVISQLDLDTNKSVLDAVLESAMLVRGRLGSFDQQRLDQYLQSVRSVEKRVTQMPEGKACPRPEAPEFPDLSQNQQFLQNSGGYDKGAHADLMHDLLALAFQCDLTRVVSYMLEDEGSEFVYDGVPLRTFTAQGSAPASGVCGQYVQAQQQSQDEYASITRWNVQKVAELCQRLSQIDDGGGKSVLDNSVIFLGSCMHGSDLRADRLPAVLLGGGAGALKTDLHVDLTNRPLRDLYYTLARGVYRMDLPGLGTNRTGSASTTITEILAV